MKVLNWVTVILVVVGGLNWGLVGFANYNLVDSLLGAGSSMSILVYDLVGLSALYLVFRVKKMV